MSNRLIDYWGKSSEEAFGNAGKVGDDTELKVVSYFTNLGYKVTHYPSQQEKQISGVDMVVHGSKKDMLIDVKGNVNIEENNRGAFIIEVEEDGWLFNSKKVSDILIHVNHTTNIEILIQYNRLPMMEYIINNKSNIKTKIIDGTKIAYFGGNLYWNNKVPYFVRVVDWRRNS